MRTRRLLRMVLPLLAVGLWTCRAAAAEKTARLSGPALEKVLRSEMSVEWRDNPLRGGLNRLCDAHAVSVLLDRRVDPGQELSLKLRDETLRDAFAQIAAERRIGYSQFGSVAYLGPREAAKKLRTVAALRKEDVAKLPAEARKLLLRQKAWSWDDLATPRQLLDQLAEEAGVTIRGAEGIPHDLWAKADLAPQTWIDRLSLILVQFNATFDVGKSGREVSLVDMPEEVSISRTFPGGAKPAELAAQWERILPDCQIKVADRKIVVRGRVEDLEQIETTQQGTATKTKVTGAKEVRYTLTIQKQPLAGVLTQVADQAKLNLRFDEAAIKQAGIALDQRVSAEVKDATLDELLEELLKPAGLKFRRQDTTIEIGPAE